jgi:hypothetical protein
MDVALFAALHPQDWLNDDTSVVRSSMTALRNVYEGSMLKQVVVLVDLARSPRWQVLVQAARLFIEITAVSTVNAFFHR